MEFDADLSDPDVIQEAALNDEQSSEDVWTRVKAKYQDDSEKQQQELEQNRIKEDIKRKNIKYANCGIL